MIFKKLELINFKSHANTIINFNEGISLIVGENGAGKSSVFEAITFALFTESQITNKDLVRANKGLSDTVIMEVKLTFDANGNEYRVERKVKKKNDNATSTAKLIQISASSEETIAEKVTEVNREVQQIINMDSQTYLNAIHIRQGEISNLIDQQPAERKKLIGQLLRIDDLETAYKQMAEITKEYEFKLGNLEGKIEKEDELDTKIKEFTQGKESIQKELNELIKNLEETKKEYEIKTAEKNNLDEQKTKLYALKVKKESESKQLDILNKSKEDLAKNYNEILRNETEMVALKPSCDRLNAYTQFKESLLKFRNLKKEENSITELLEKISNYKEVILTEQENYNKYIELEIELKETNEKKTKIESDVKRIDELEGQKKSKQENIGQFSQTLNDLYNTCENDLSNYYDGEININEKSFDDIEKFIDSLKANIKNEILEIDGQIALNTNEVGGLNQEIKSSKKQLGEIKKVDNKCPTCQSDIDENKKKQLINTYEQTISDNQNKINELNQLQNELNNKKSLKNDELTSLESIKSNITKHKHIPEQVETINLEIKNIDEKLAELNAKKENLFKLVKTIESKTSEFEVYKISKNKYIEAKTLLNNQKDEDELKNQLNNISKDIITNEEQLQQLIDNDSLLSFEIKLELLNKEIDKLTEKNAKYNNLAGSVKYKEEYETKIKQNEEDIKSKETEIETIVKKIESCTYDEEIHKNTKNSVDEMTKNINEFNKNIAVKQEQVKTLEKQISETDEKIEKNKIYISEYNSTKDYLDLLNDFRQHYSKNGVQKDLRSQSRPIIQSYTQSFFEKFNFNYSELQLNDEYDISIFGPEGKITLDMVSGGEKIAIALSLRLAITQAMSQGNIETILLDEPTIHLDSFRRQELINVLRSMKIIPQMIIVTHDSELETAADTLIKIEKEDGISKVIDD